jgi:predicted PhzF superfamily epimerase YddE/YHI9
MIYTILAVIAAFSGGVYLGWSAAIVAACESVRRGTMQKIVEDYEEAFGRSGK